MDPHWEGFSAHKASNDLYDLLKIVKSQECQEPAFPTSMLLGSSVYDFSFDIFNLIQSRTGGPKDVLPQAEVPGGFCHSIHGRWTWPAQGSDQISPDSCLPATPHGPLGMPCALDLGRFGHVFGHDKWIDRDAPVCWQRIRMHDAPVHMDKTLPNIQFTSNYPKNVFSRCPVFYHLVSVYGP